MISYEKQKPATDTWKYVWNLIKEIHGTGHVQVGLRHVVERLFGERFLTDGQLVEGQFVKVALHEVYTILQWRREEKYNTFIDEFFFI